MFPRVKQTFKQTFIIAHEDISDLVKHHLILERDSDDHTKIINHRAGNYARHFKNFSRNKKI